MQKPSVILIGMPGAGKSTLGILLAKELGLGFLDTDVAIQVKEKQTLQEILEQRGYLALRAVEEQVLLETDCHQQVVATGGSAVYSHNGMAYLKSCGPVVYLEVPLEDCADAFITTKPAVLPGGPTNPLPSYLMSARPCIASTPI